MVPMQAEPPKKYRRRWLIVALVLVLVSMSSWWSWPRRDARFVGKWRINVGPHQIWHLKANGVATLHAAKTFPALRSPTFHTSWSSQGEVLMIGRSWYAPPRPVWKDRLISLFCQYIPSHQILDKGYCLQLNLIEPDRLDGVEGRWPDEPAPDPNVIYLKHILWWDDFEGEDKFGDIQYKLRKVIE